MHYASASLTAWFGSLLRLKSSSSTEQADEQAYHCNKESKLHNNWHHTLGGDGVASNTLYS
jgi:hypothetical protein